MLEEKTRQFFNQPLNQLLDQFVDGEGMVIVAPNTERRIRVIEAESFPQVGLRWNATRKMEPGDLWSPRFFNRTQSLVVARGSERVGACIRLIEAEYFDPVSDFYVPELQIEGELFSPKEDDIARYLGLSINERSKLVFLDQSDVLYLVRGVYV